MMYFIAMLAFFQYWYTNHNNIYVCVLLLQLLLSLGSSGKALSG
jgi:hypothetical protein